MSAIQLPVYLRVEPDETAGSFRELVDASYSSVSANAPGHSTPHPQHNSFMSIAALTPQQIVIKLRKSRFILYNSLRRLCASLNLFLGGGLYAFWWFWVELAVQLPGLPQKLYHPQHALDAL
jgi:hypothetical protein